MALQQDAHPNELIDNLSKTDLQILASMQEFTKATGSASEMLKDSELLEKEVETEGNLEEQFKQVLQDSHML